MKNYKSYTIKHSCEKTFYLPGISREENRDKYYLLMEICLSGTKISAFGWILDSEPTVKEIKEYEEYCWKEFNN